MWLRLSQPLFLPSPPVGRSDGLCVRPHSDPVRGPEMSERSLSRSDQAWLSLQLVAPQALHGASLVVDSTRWLTDLSHLVGHLMPRVSLQTPPSRWTRPEILLLSLLRPRSWQV